MYNNNINIASSRYSWPEYHQYMSCNICQSLACNHHSTWKTYSKVNTNNIWSIEYSCFIYGVHFRVNVLFPNNDFDTAVLICGHHCRAIVHVHSGMNASCKKSSHSEQIILYFGVHYLSHNCLTYISLITLVIPWYILYYGWLVGNLCFTTTGNFSSLAL